MARKKKGNTATATLGEVKALLGSLGLSAELAVVLMAENKIQSGQWPAFPDLLEQFSALIPAYRGIPHAQTLRLDLDTLKGRARASILLGDQGETCTLLARR